MGKVKIEIEVDPVMAVLTMGIVKGLFPDMMAVIKKAVPGGETTVQGLSDHDAQRMEEVLDEILTKCLEQSPIKIVQKIQVEKKGGVN